MNIPNMHTGTWWTDFWLFSLAVFGSLLTGTLRKLTHRPIGENAQ